MERSLCTAMLFVALSLQHRAASMPAAPLSGIKPRKVASFSLPYAATASISPQVTAAAGVPWFPGDGPGILFTSFNVLAGDGVWAIPSAQGLLKNESLHLNLIDGHIPWPNQAELAPEGAIPGHTVVLECGGFFPNPAKSTGRIVLTDVTGSSHTNYQISTNKRGFFYHRAIWHDMNGDGRLDVVAARAQEPLIPIGTHPAGELIWLEQPAVEPMETGWTEHVLVSPKGPDVSFQMVDLDSDGVFEVVAGQFFDAKQLSLFWCEKPSWADCNTSTVQSVVIDSTAGPVFNLMMEDLNGDGKKDLLVTTNLNDGTGGVYVYEVPAKPRTDPWKRHLLIQGFKPMHSFLPGQGGPGTAKAFYPVQGLHPKPRPSILISGDDNGTAVVLTPESEGAAYDWKYTVDTLCVGSGTIGTPAVGNLDGDMFAEIVVPMFADNRVDVYTYAPPSLSGARRTEVLP